jgi:hypothetical protein
LRAPPPRWGTPILGPHWGARVALTRLTRGLAVGKGVRQARSGDVSPRRCGSLQPLRCPAMRWGGARGIPLSPCVLTLTLTPTPTLTLLESSSRVSPQAVRSWDRPPFRHIKNQSCFLGSGSRFRWTNLGLTRGTLCCPPCPSSRLGHNSSFPLPTRPMAVVLAQPAPGEQSLMELEVRSRAKACTRLNTGVVSCEPVEPKQPHSPRVRSALTSPRTGTHASAARGPPRETRNSIEVEMVRWRCGGCIPRPRRWYTSSAQAPRSSTRCGVACARTTQTPSTTSTPSGPPG